MKHLITYPVIVTLFLLFCQSSYSNVNYYKDSNEFEVDNLFLAKNSIPPVAENDTFVLFTGCNRNQVSGNLLSNDFDPNGDAFEVFYCISPKQGHLTHNKNGDFELTLIENSGEPVVFEYCITELTEQSFKSVAKVVIYVKPDCDCDNVTDADDLDNDNDGITDADEGNGKIDSDYDGIPDNLDIDSDNDGITDNVEWQNEKKYRIPTGKDTNKNGWDDAYDIYAGGEYYRAIDTDTDNLPDYIDRDSDADGKSDLIEGNQLYGEIKPAICLTFSDFDKDGLDDVFDCVPDWLQQYNSYGSYAPTPDLNGNGIRDWREITGEVTNFAVFPNPANQNIRILSQNLIDFTKTTFSIYNTNSKIVCSKNITNGNYFVDLSSLSEGMYFVTIKSGNIYETKKILISR